MSPETPARPVAPVEIFKVFLGLGLTAFGGPVAHIAYFRRELVERRRWLGEAAFADLLALCHFLPGPASSQIGMAIGLRQAGLSGALAAFAGFTLPAAAAMLALAAAAPRLNSVLGGAWVHGLAIVVAAVVLQALLGMARTLAAGPVRAGLALGAAAGLVVAGGPTAQIAALATGAAIGCLLLRDEAADSSIPADTQAQFDRGAGNLSLLLFGALLIGLPILAAALGNPGLGLASVFYRTGALVFGGGHVVLPLLESEVVGRGWMPLDRFLTGYGVIQALPGPLFAFAAFVGAGQTYGPSGVVGGLIALLAIFLPSLLLIVGVLPYWEALKRQAWARGLVAGAGAVVVGLLAATLWDPVLTSAVRRPGDLALIAAAFVFLQVARMPPWIVAPGFAVLTSVFGLS